MLKIKKLLKKVPQNYKQNILDTLNLIYLKEFSTLDILKIKGKNNHYRIRVGKFRIIFYMDDSITEIIDIKKRDENTYKNL